MKWTSVGALAAVLLGAAVFGACSRWQRGASESLKLYGNIELTQVDMAFKISGKIAELEVNEGDAVRQGMLLARLDALQLESQRKRDQAALVTAESLIPPLQTSIRIKPSHAVFVDNTRRTIAVNTCRDLYIIQHYK